ncbi:hypothetical protein OF83DRAFT_1169981 [Amylostereum chailletii]|nr:hypothetical protein OF83DRAFT_1169981 [Amylostereum chailletii]
MSEENRNLSPVLVPVLVGSLVTWFLFGINVVQVYIYALSFPRDHKLVRITVYGIFIMECFQIAVATAAPWSLLCDGWGQESALTRVRWQDPFIPLVDGLVGTWVQLFYAWRIHILGRSKLWTTISVGLLPVTATSLVIVIYSAGRIFRLHTTEEVLALGDYQTAWLVTSMVCDVIIAGSMVYVLFISRRRIADARNTTTHKRITFLIRLSIETGCVTALAATFFLVSFLALKNTTLYIGVGLVISKVYSNSLMVSLNSRIYARNGNNATSKSDDTDPGTSLPSRRPRIVISDIHVVDVTASSETFEDRRHDKLTYEHEGAIPLDSVSAPVSIV